MQSHMIGMQSSLDRILSVLQTQAQASGSMPPSNNPSVMQYPMNGDGSSPGDVQDRKAFPPLPGFAPPVCSSLLLITPYMSGS